MTIKELRTQMMKLKRTEPEKAKVYSALLSSALLIAKEDKNREANDNDIVAAAKKELKMAEQSKASGAPYNEFVFEICEEFLPKMLSEEETIKLLNEIVSKIDKPNIGQIMKMLPKDVDKGLASKLLKNIL